MASGIDIADTSVADAIAANIGPDLSPAESPPGRSLAEMERETLELILLAIDGTARQLQQVLFTRRMQPAQHDAFASKIGRLQTAGNQLRRFLAGPSQAA